MYAHASTYMYVYIYVCIRKSKFRMVLPVLKHWMVAEHPRGPSFTATHTTVPITLKMRWFDDIWCNLLTWTSNIERHRGWFTTEKKKWPWHWKILDGLISCVDPERIPDSGSVIAKAITPIETIKYVGHPGSARDSEDWHEGFTNKIWFFHPNGILDDSTMMNLGLYTTKTPDWSGGLKFFLHPWEWTNWRFFNPHLAVELSPCLAAWHESLLVDLGTGGLEEWWLDLTFAWHWGYMFDRWGISWWTPSSLWSWKLMSAES